MEAQKIEAPAPRRGIQKLRRERVRALWFDGVPACEIAALVGVSAVAVYMMYKRNGWPRRVRVVKYEVAS
jgi:uncharacterized protein YjcR